MSGLDPFNTHRASKIQSNESQLGSGGINCEGRWVESCGLVQTTDRRSHSKTQQQREHESVKSLCGLLQILEKFSIETPAQHKQEFWEIVFKARTCPFAKFSLTASITTDQATQVFFFDICCYFGRLSVFFAGNYQFQHYDVAFCVIPWCRTLH